MNTAPELLKTLKKNVAQLEECISVRTDSAQATDDSLTRAAFLAVRLYAETHPRPTQVNQAQAAEILGISHVTVRKLIRAGTIQLNALGQIPISEIDKALQVRRNS